MLLDINRTTDSLFSSSYRHFESLQQRIDYKEGPKQCSQYTSSRVNTAIVGLTHELLNFSEFSNLLFDEPHAL